MKHDVQFGALGGRDMAMDWYFEFDPLMLCPDTPIFDVMREALLVAVEIDSADPLTCFNSATATCIAMVVT